MYSTCTNTPSLTHVHPPCMESEYGARLMLRRPFSAAAARTALTGFVPTELMGIRGGGAIIRRACDEEVEWECGAAAA